VLSVRSVLPQRFVSALFHLGVMTTEAVNPDIDEELLICQLQQGDERAFGVLYRRHVAHVQRAAQQVVVDPQVAEDVAQEVFAYLWRNPSRVDLQRGQLRTLLTTMSRYKAIDAVRAESNRRRRQLLVSSEPESTYCPVAADVADTVAQADTCSRRVRAVRAAVAELPEPQRVSVELAYFAGHTFREVAQITSVPEGTAKSRLTSALHRLERQLPAALFGATNELATAGQRAS
jgi:RNA polymerase sigma factor (sigma-70 family)